ncbi:Metalloenzyme, LuxS/M16 peptidase-like protein [Aspergillus floccosus]
MVKEREPEQWIFDQMKNLAEIDPSASRVAPERVLAAYYNPDLIKKALSYFRPDNFRMIIVSRAYPGDWGSKRKALETTPDTRLPGLHMPHKNLFVPSRLCVAKKEAPEPQKVPKLIHHDDHVRLWLKKDDRFWVPKATVYVTLRNTVVYATPVNLPSDAKLAGLGYDLSASTFGLDLSVAGYNEKMSVLLAKVLTSMRYLTVDSVRFYIIKERLARGFKNAEYRRPFRQVGNYTLYLTAEKNWLNEHYAAELEHVKPEDISYLFPQLLRQNHNEVTDEPAFDQLRSKQQLGYVVWSEYLESRIDAFLSSFRKSLQDMTEEELEEHKRSVINKQLEKPKNLGSETSRFWTHIGSEYFDFLQSESDAANVRLWTKDDMIKFYNQYIDPASPTRGKVSVHLNAQSGAHVAPTDVKEQKTRLVSLLGKQLETAGFAVDEDRLSTAFEKLDISTGGEGKILDVFGTFLGSDMSLSEQQTKPILEQAQQNLGLHLKQLGLGSKPTSVANGVDASYKHPVYITNIPKFKARLAVSAGPSPITDLSEFEGPDAKL